VLKLDDSRPSFVFHGSCSNGTPESALNLGYTLLLHGAIGTVSSSRVAIITLTTGPTSRANIFGVEEDFTGHLLEGKSAGEALFEAKRKITDELGMLTWFTRLEINLYGDPSIALLACTSDSGCDDGKKCNGAETCKTGLCVAGTPVDCGQADPCTEGTCEEATGTCKTAPRPDGEACDDGKFCTLDETCIKGRCMGMPRCALSDNPCATSSCDESGRTCSTSFGEQEGNACRQGTEREGTCGAGLCRPGAGGGCAVAGRSGSAGPLPRVPAAPLVLVLAAPAALVARAAARQRARRRGAARRAAAARSRDHQGEQG
jgi:hypothetical protein